VQPAIEGTLARGQQAPASEAIGTTRSGGDLMPVDSFKYLPRVLAAFYQMTEVKPVLPVPWAPMSRPLTECRFGLVTTGGLYHSASSPPFDLDRERQEPTWGDPSYRRIPSDIGQSEAGVSHLHLNTRDVLADINILLPVHRFQELVAQGRVGGLARSAYSFMGYQGFPPDTRCWEEDSGPQVAAGLMGQGVDCVLLTPA
jgi:D-proline reductase (dithiol) PrdB